MSAWHLHRADCPKTLVLLEGLLDSYQPGPGYEPTPTGAWVDWEVLDQTHVLSSTEKAAVVVARGLSQAEARGGWGARVQQLVLDAIEVRS